MDPNVRIAELEAQLAKLQAKKEINIIVSQKGCVQINGIRKFPFTFYKKELEIILNMKNELEEFVKTNDNQLK
tara:strand:+ start:476 stop:694 length:219 start_codon:yes stop_codon:yes gene_type:complete